MKTGLLQQIPFGLTTLRLALAPTLALLAITGHSGWLMIACLLVALFSDIFDGIIARRLGVETAALRRYDSIADTIFYLGVGFAVWTLCPDVIHSNWLLLAMLIALELLRYGFDWLKFRREASYHMWSSKAWGLLLAAAAIALLGFGYSGWLFRAAIILGIICDLEGLMISVVLPNWTHNVKSFAHALRLRRTPAAGD